MSKEGITFEECDSLVKEFERVVKNPVTNGSSVYYTGVDLGTACVVVAVLDENFKPAAGAYRYADVVRDGMVVDYIGAIRIVREMKAELEEKLGCELLYAAAVQGAGFEITALLDEPTAANAVLKIKNGAVVDIGGGTTGIAILKDGKVVYVADEATGGTHFSLVISGAYGLPFGEAERYKRDPSHHKELLPVLKPVVEKISSIINRHLEGHQVEGIYLVGGTCCLAGIEDIIEKRTGIPTYKPDNPMFVTPLGIARSCTQEASE